MTPQAANNTVSNPSGQVLVPLDGGLSVAGGIPTLDPQSATRAYAQAPRFVESISPAPAPAPAPFEAPPDFADEPGEDYVNAPRPGRGFN